MNPSPRQPAPIDASGGEAAVIGYNVPLPTSHTGSRMLEIDDLKKDIWLEEATTTVADIIKDNSLATKTTGGGYKVNIENAYQYWKEQAMLAGMSSDDAENARATWEQNTGKKP